MINFITRALATIAILLFGFAAINNFWISDTSKRDDVIHHWTVKDLPRPSPH